MRGVRRRLFGFLHRFLEFLSMSSACFFRVHGLAENRFLPSFLFAHGLAADSKSAKVFGLTAAYAQSPPWYRDRPSISRCSMGTLFQTVPT